MKSTQLAAIIILALVAGAIGFVAYQATQRPPPPDAAASFAPELLACLRAEMPAGRQNAPAGQRGSPGPPRPS